MDAQFSQQLQYDVITQIRFPSMQSFVNFRNDSFYKEMVMPDHDVFTDADKTFITVGWVEDHIVDGRAAQGVRIIRMVFYEKKKINKTK